MALKDMKSNLAKGAGTPDEVAKLRGKNVMEIAPKGLVDAYENTKAERKLKEDAKG